MSWLSCQYDYTGHVNQIDHFILKQLVDKKWKLWHTEQKKDESLDRFQTDFKRYDFLGTISRGLDKKSSLKS